MLKAVLFDHDGTLVNSEEIHFQLWRDIVAGYGVQLREAEYRNYYAGVPTRQNAEDLAQRHGLSVDIGVLTERKHQAARDYLAQRAFPAMPYADQVLRQLRAEGWRLAIVTGSTRNCVDATLAEHGWEALFETIVSSEDVVQSKPAPDCYQLALTRMGLLPAQAVAIEDTYHGLTAAWRAHLACVVVPNEMTAQQDFSLARAQLPSLGELPAWLAAQAQP